MSHKNTSRRKAFDYKKLFEEKCQKKLNYLPLKRQGFFRAGS
jgi:hypothetical protein